MGLIGKSLNDLRAERDALQAKIDSQAAHLAGRMASNDELISQLMPLTTKLVALKHQILHKTPRSELVTTRKELERFVAQPSKRSTLVLEFRIATIADATTLKLRASGFPTPPIFKHLDFYRGGTLEIFKRHVERRRIS